MAGRKTDKDQSTIPASAADKQQGGSSPIREELVLPFPDCHIDAQGRRQLPNIFDEINTTRVPIAMVVRNGEALTKHTFDIKEDRFVEAVDERTLPSGHAARIFVGLLNIYRQKDPEFTSPRFKFSLRRLVDDWIYPNSSNRANAKAMALAAEQLDRLAHMRVYTNAWQERTTGKAQRIQMNGALIDSLKTISEGNNNAPHTIEINWGSEMYRSLQSKFTKPLDAEVFHAIKGPIPLALYRFLDSQFYYERSFKRKSIQQVALSLGMSGDIRRGGRTASSYAAKGLTRAVKHLNECGFHFKMEINRRPADFEVTFTKLEKPMPSPSEPPTPLLVASSEMDSDDDAAQLLQHFATVVHGAKVFRTFHPNDRALAQTWVDAYGLEASKWMTVKAAELLKHDTGKKPRAFRRLDMYTESAQGAWERHVAATSGQQSLQLKDTTPRQPALPDYNAYIAAVLKKVEDPRIERQIQKKVETDLQEDAGWRVAGEHMQEQWRRGALHTAHVQAYGLLNRDEYEAVASLSELKKVLQERHSITLEEIA